MHGYDSIKDTWIYQEIKQEVQTEEREERVAEQRQTLLEIVQVRFPRLTPLVKQVAERLTEPEALRRLIVKVSTARIEKEARQELE